MNNALAPANDSPLAAAVGEKRKRGFVDDSGPPVKRLKLMESADRQVEENMMDVDVESADRRVAADAMDVDAGPSVDGQTEPGVQGDAMDVDPEPVVEDSLNGRILSHAFGIPGREFVFERVTYLS